MPGAMTEPLIADVQPAGGLGPCVTSVVATATLLVAAVAALNRWERRLAAAGTPIPAR